ncbi:MAG: FAD-dependent oxidoreductase [Cytophagaceae bacterium]|nr:FAD-dependent oxidoreductase [Cytophagaceae bacterium]
MPLLVVGGSTSGVMAGIQSARLGVKTLLVEEGSWLGGMLTSAGVSAIDGNHELPSGLWGEFRTALEKHYGGPEKLQTGWVSNTQFEPSVGEKILRQMTARESNLLVLTELRTDEIVQTNKGWIAKFVDKKGAKIYVKAQILIDATELGDVAAKVPGVRYDVGMDARDSTGERAAPRQANNIVQDLTYAAILKDFGPGVDRTLPRPIGYDRAVFLCSCKKLCPDSTRPRLHDCDKILSYARLPNQKVLINWPIEGNDFYANLIDASAEIRQRTLQKAKEHTLKFVYFLQTELGYRNLGLAEDEFPTPDRLPLIAYHRESRRIWGEVRLTMNHIEKPFSQPEKLYRTGITVGDYPIDHHHAKYPTDVPDLHFVPVPSYNVPLGSLLPKGIDNLIVAEKSISVTNLANGTTRLQPVVMGIGQAAGALAALAVKAKCVPQKVPIREVQDELLKAGAYLMPYNDVKPNHPQWVAIQRLGATGILKGVPTPQAWANQTWFYPDSSIRVREFLDGWQEFFPEVPAPLTPSEARLTVRQAQLFVEAIRRSPKFNLSVFRKSVKPEDRPISRAELAAMIDQGVDPFHRKTVDFDGDLVRKTRTASTANQP